MNELAGFLRAQNYSCIVWEAVKCSLVTVP